MEEENLPTCFILDELVGDVKNYRSNIDFNGSGTVTAIEVS